MTKKDTELSFHLERTPAMKFLGSLWTGSFSGQVIVSALFLIGLFFMANQKFNILSISFFIGFTLPICYLLHTRIVRRGKKLMKTWCDIKVENETLHFRTGFPNTTIPGWQEVTLDTENRDLIIKGNEVGGYHLRLSGETIVRLGLWLDLEQARSSAAILSELTKGSVSEQLLKK
ncbi:MAG: hypothetical protein ACW99A_07320 [Candidatus Kariarchaeaceae archaeon]|jgi:hypothetical protein